MRRAVNYYLFFRNLCIGAVAGLLVFMAIRHIAPVSWYFMLVPLGVLMAFALHAANEWADYDEENRLTLVAQKRSIKPRTRRVSLNGLVWCIIILGVLGVFLSVPWIFQQLMIISLLGAGAVLGWRLWKNSHARDKSLTIHPSDGCKKKPAWWQRSDRRYYRGDMPRR